MEDYNVITEFESYGKNMVVVRMNRAACVMEEMEWKNMRNLIIRNQEVNVA